MPCQIGRTHSQVSACPSIDYGVDKISRLLKIICLFCRVQSFLQGSFAKETYNFEEPPNHSHPICKTGTEHAFFRIYRAPLDVSAFIFISVYHSLLHLECHFLNLKSQSIIQFSRSLLPSSVEKRPLRLRMEIEIE